MSSGRSAKLSATTLPPPERGPPLVGRGGFLTASRGGAVALVVGLAPLRMGPHLHCVFQGRSVGRPYESLANGVRSFLRPLEGPGGSFQEPAGHRSLFGPTPLD
eukprot:3074491-Pyramimonas_sp.AAC.1